MRVTIVSPAIWRTFRRLPQFIALALAEQGHEVLYVDPPVSPLSLVRHRDRWQDLVAPADATPAPGVSVWRPRVLPGQNSRLGQDANARLLERGIRRRMARPDLVVGFSLESRGVLARLNGHKAFYLGDSLEDVPGADPERVRAREQGAIDAVDTVIACSKPLVAQLAARGVAAHYIPHGCDRLPDAAGIATPELDGLPRPIIGYIGSLNFRIDARLLEAAITASRGGTLVLVGGRASGAGPPPDREAAALLARADVVTTGHKSSEILPAYLRAFDVGVAPYRIGAFNRKSFPLKIPQYLAAGLPVVSTPNGATDEVGHLVEVADDPTTFGAAVARSLASSTEGRAARQAWADAHPWTVAAEAMLAACGLG